MFKGILDCVLVPSGLLLMSVYHVWLFRRVLRHPTTTVIGINAIGRKFWVRSMMEDTSKNGILAVQTLRNNMMASTVLASAAIMLSSVVAMLMTGGVGNRIRPTAFIYGDRSDLGFSIKYFSILVCFMMAFLFIIQSIRYYNHAGILINIPNIHKKRLLNLDHNNNYSDCLTPEHVERTVNRGSFFWALGLRTFYFSFPLFFWIFGPIPMFLCCIFMVFLLYFLDIAFDHKWVAVEIAQHCDDEEAVIHCS